ncbi:MAG: hypothetical protein JW708_04705, partial [Vallitaleaceae bacterium]|nr:hypothetical protein [Vallitaleaceae bacterium]
MRKKINTVSLVVLSITLLFSTLQWSAAAYAPPTTYGKPENVAAVFNEDGGDGRWSFDLGLSASPEIRALLTSVEDGSFEAAGYDSLGVSVLGDFRLDGGAWRSSMSDYDEWVNPQDSYFDAAGNVWVGNWHIYDEYFEGIIPVAALQGENDYFDQHELEFRLRFAVSFYHSESGESYAYESPWSEVVSYSNSQELYDPSSLIAHAPELTSVELKEHDDGSPYLIFQAKQVHDDIAMLNSISNQRVYTNVWIRVDNGAWTDVGSYMFLKESFEVDAQDYFGELENYAQAKYEAKFRYTFDYSFYPAAGKSGEIASPYS